MATTTRSHSRSTPEGLPLLVGLQEELLPLLGLLWGVVIFGFIATTRPAWLAAGFWASLTTIMLWPVGRRIGLPYLSYRRPAFIVGVLSMAYVPLLGVALDSSLSSFAARAAIFFGAIAVLTIFGIVPALQRGIGRPMPMFFRPDILFGDGRVLCCGALALIVGMRYMWGPTLGITPFPLPIWNWWGLLYAMLFGFFILIPLRGMVKLRLRLAQMAHGRWTGWGGLVVTESLLLIGVLNIAYGFLNAFLGRTPFTWSPRSLWMLLQGDWGGALAGLLIMSLSAAGLIIARGWYKRAIGMPFFRETEKQTMIKQLIMLLGIIPFLYGFMTFITGQLRPLNHGGSLAVGLVWFVWGTIMLTVFRLISLRNQRRAIMKQMMTIILPSFPEAVRKQVMAKNLVAFCGVPETQRHLLISTMMQILDGMQEAPRVAMRITMMEVMAELPGDQRQLLMRTMDRVLSGGVA